MLTRSQKEELVKSLVEEIKSSKVVIFSDFAGTSVKNMKKLRDSLRKGGSKYKIAKKKLIQIAFRKAGIDVDTKSLAGQIGIALGQTDEVSSAKTLKIFTKENKNFKMLMGILEGKIMNEQEVSALAEVPSKEELLARFVGSINAPLSGFANVLAGNIRNLVGVFKAIVNNK